MKQLDIDWFQLTTAFDESFPEINYYLDTETGSILVVAEENSQQLEQVYKKHFDDNNPDAFDIQAALSQTNFQDWEQEMIAAAYLVESHFGSRVIAIPDRSSYDGYDEMEDFIATVTDSRLQDRLYNAIRGKGAFSRFRDTLRQHLAEQERWYVFQENRLRKRILEWLEEEEIELITMPQPRKAEPEALLKLRYKLLDEVLIFVRAAGKLPGVVRVALIGSLTTDKIDPKDADLLVTVTADMDLTPLATLGRQLHGHCQAFNRGGEVFLADEEGRYLGRACPWKWCEPGIRTSCDALYCGQRPFLHDDLRAVTLSTELIAEPPFTLWPQITARVPAPDDLDERVLRPLQQQT